MVYDMHGPTIKDMWDQSVDVAVLKVSNYIFRIQSFDFRFVLLIVSG